MVEGLIFIATWQEFEDYLCYQLKHLGADKKATDAARVLRLPDTFNSRNNAECKVAVKGDVEMTYYKKQHYIGTGSFINTTYEWQGRTLRTTPYTVYSW